MAGPYNVLFLCTGNSARSILAEAILNRIGQGRFVAYSAGSMPKGEVNPHALSFLERAGYPTDGFRSKSWDEFVAPGDPKFDFIFTVCDNAAGEVCPIWPGKPITGHWGIPDPAAVEGADVEIALAFTEAHRRLSRMIEALLNLPMDKLDRLALKQRISEIGSAERAPQPS